MTTKTLKELISQKCFSDGIVIPEELLEITTEEMQGILKRNIGRGKITMTGFYPESMVKMGLLKPIQDLPHQYEFTTLARTYA